MDPPRCLFTPTQKETSRPAARRDWSQMDLEVLGVPQRGGHSLLCRWEEGSSPLPGQQGTFKWCARLWLPQGSQPLLEVCHQRLSSSCLQVVAAGENPPSCCKTKITGDTTEARQQRGMRGPPDTGFPGLPQAAHSPCLMDRDTAWRPCPSLEHGTARDRWAGWALYQDATPRGRSHYSQRGPVFICMVFPRRGSKEPSLF